MTNIIKTFQYGFVILAVLAFAYLTGVHTMIAKAAGMVFAPVDCYTAAATSTLRYMTPGTATTTVTCPMGNDGANSAVLAIQINASSTDSTFDVYVEESMDGVDWYPVPSQSVGSTSPMFALGTRPYSRFQFAASTVGGSVGGSGIGLSGTQNRNHYELDVPVRMKRVRAYMGMASTSTTGAAMNGAAWMQIIPKISI